MKGLIHLYCGDGKGKTTAAMGLALRAAAHGKQVMIIQFLKDGSSGEIQQLKKQENIFVVGGVATKSFSWMMTAKEKEETTELHNEFIKKAMDYDGDMLILDELCSACTTGLIEIPLVEQVIAHKPYHQELVVTGRNPPSFIWDRADYITEMKMIKHPFQQGISGRKGIEF